MDDSKKAAQAWTNDQTKHARRASLPVLALSIASLAASVAQAWCAASLLGAVLTGHAPPTTLLAAFAGLIAVRAALNYAAEMAGFRAGAAGRARLRHDIFARMMQAGPALLRTTHSADLAASVVDRIEALDGLFARWAPAAMMGLIGPALILICAWAASPFAAIILLAAGLLVPFGQALSGIGAAAASRSQFLAMARLQTRFLDRVRGIATIVLAGRAEDEASSLAQAAAELRQRTMRVLRVAFLSSAATDIAMAAALVTIAVHFRPLLRGATAAQSSTALFALLLVAEFFAPLRAFAAAYQDRMHATGAAEALIALPAAPAAAQAQGPLRTIEARGLAIAFEHVRLTWDDTRGPALDDVSFFVAQGEMLLLTGPSGAGKSSILELLLGFARPESGRILLNGHNIADIVPGALCRLTAWIGQKPTLFAGSIRDNIAFAKPEATQAEIEDAARQARILEFSDSLPAGLDTQIGEGGYGLSGGQAQRVAIARAFLKNAPLLLLDEPTAHLDPATESDVFASLKRLAVGRTVVMASHASAAHAFSGRRIDLRDGRVTAARGAA